MVYNPFYPVGDCNLALYSKLVRHCTEIYALDDDGFFLLGGSVWLAHLTKWQRVANHYARYEKEPVPLIVGLPVACVLVKTYEYRKNNCSFYYVCYRRMHCYLDLFSIICFISPISRSDTGSSSTM